MRGCFNEKHNAQLVFRWQKWGWDKRCCLIDECKFLPWSHPYFVRYLVSQCLHQLVHGCMLPAVVGTCFKHSVAVGRRVRILDQKRQEWDGWKLIRGRICFEYVHRAMFTTVTFSPLAHNNSKSAEIWRRDRDVCALDTASALISRLRMQWQEIGLCRCWEVLFSQRNRRPEQSTQQSTKIYDCSMPKMLGSVLGSNNQVRSRRKVARLPKDRLGCKQADCLRAQGGSRFYHAEWFVKAESWQTYHRCSIHSTEISRLSDLKTLWVLGI